MASVLAKKMTLKSIWDGPCSARLPACQMPWGRQEKKLPQMEFHALLITQGETFGLVKKPNTGSRSVGRTVRVLRVRDVWFQTAVQSNTYSSLLGSEAVHFELQVQTFRRILLPPWKYNYWNQKLYLEFSVFFPHNLWRTQEFCSGGVQKIQLRTRTRIWGR